MFVQLSDIRQVERAMGSGCVNAALQGFHRAMSAIAGSIPAREQAAADVSGGDMFFNFRNNDRQIQIKEAHELRRAP